MPITIPSLTAGLLALAGGPAAVDPPPPFPVPTQAEAWQMLPRKNPPLPAWAAALAKPMPRGTGKLVELDDLHRTANPLGPVLRAKLRWAAADANGCAYAKEYAEADLRRAGLTPAQIETLATPEKLPADERAALAFTRKLSRAAHTVTDAEVADLVRHYGHKSVVGIVHTIAYANFQDRLLIGLGTAVEEGGPLPPVGVAFDPTRVKPRPEPAAPTTGAAKVAAPTAKFAWPDAGLDLRARLDAQKARAPRIPPVEASALAGLPTAAREQAEKVVWSNISMGYQPILTGTWFASMAACQQDAAFDRVLSNSVFWVVTRSNQCFY